MYEHLYHYSTKRRPQARYCRSLDGSMSGTRCRNPETCTQSCVNAGAQPSAWRDDAPYASAMDRCGCLVCKFNAALAGLLETWALWLRR